MYKKILLIGVLMVALASVGCSTLQGFAEEYVPTVEANLGSAGIAVEIDPKFGIDKFCIDPMGQAAKLINKIPFLGAVTADFVGLCDEEEVE